MTSQRKGNVRVLRERERSLFIVKSSSRLEGHGCGAVREHFHSRRSLHWWWWMRFMLGLTSWLYSVRSVLGRGRWPGVPLWSASGQAFLQLWWMRWWISGSAEVLCNQFLSKHADAIYLTLCFLRRCGTMGCIIEKAATTAGLCFLK